MATLFAEREQMDMTDGDAMRAMIDKHRPEPVPTDKLRSSEFQRES